MKKLVITGLFCMGLCIPSQLSAQSLVEKVIVDVALGAYDKPRYYDKQPYYFYNNRYYYGGEWRDGAYFYKGKRLKGGRYFKQGYYDHHRDDYNRRFKAKHPNHKNGLYKHNKHYLDEHKTKKKIKTKSKKKNKK